jgi:branched-chain amino acid transport system ATP-binding protein
VLFDHLLDVGAGEVVTLLGRNGMGKTTHRALHHGPCCAPRGGEVRFDGAVVTGLAPYRIAKTASASCPRGRRSFPPSTVEENLVATAASAPLRPRRWTAGLRSTTCFRASGSGAGTSEPSSRRRAADARHRPGPDDESEARDPGRATEGLAPLIRAEIWACLARLKAEGQSILVIDKHVDALSRFADRHVVIEKGRVVWSGTTEELNRDATVKERFLHV